MTTIQSQVPRRGLSGAWDRLVGPGMTPEENVLVLSASGLGAIFAALRMAQFAGLSVVVALAALMGFDIVGGAVCNATATTRSWYHRQGQTWREHMLFVAPHLVYVVAVAAFLRGDHFDWEYACALGVGVLIASGLIIATPSRLKPPVAFAAFLVVLAGTEIQFGPTTGLEWFVPALLLKLLLGHLLGPRPQ